MIWGFTIFVETQYKQNLTQTYTLYPFGITPVKCINMQSTEGF